MQGVLVGTDKAQEWLLPWWWEHYSRHNDYPVAFADFGMSDEARAWCAAKGALLGLPDQPAKQRPAKQRKVWFKKPVACSLSPFEQTLWLDLDCETRGSLEPLFHLIPFLDTQFAAKPGCMLSGETSAGKVQFRRYNSGVLLFEPASPIIRLWKRGIEKYPLAETEDDLLAILLLQFKIPIFELPAEYNWYKRHGPNEKALIIHWIGDEGKEEIRRNFR